MRLKDYSITFSCYFNVKWPEKRLHLDPEFGREQAGPGVNHTDNPNIMVPMNLEFVKDLWWQFRETFFSIVTKTNRLDKLPRSSLASPSSQV